MRIFRRDVFELIVAFALGAVMASVYHTEQSRSKDAEAVYMKGIADGMARKPDIDFVKSLR